MQGNGTIDSPYLVGTLDDLADVYNMSSPLENLVYVRQIKDIISESLYEVDIGIGIVYDGNYHKLTNVKFDTVGRKSTIKRLHVDNKITINMHGNNQRICAGGFIDTLRGGLEDVHLKINILINGPIKTRYDKYFAYIGGVCGDVLYTSYLDANGIHNCTVESVISIGDKKDLYYINASGVIGDSSNYIVKLSKSIIKTRIEGEFNTIKGTGANSHEAVAIYLDTKSTLDNAIIYGCDNSNNVVFNHSYIMGNLKTTGANSYIYGISDKGVTLEDSYLRCTWENTVIENNYAITEDIINSYIKDSFYSIDSWNKDDYSGRYKMSDMQLRNRIEILKDTTYKKHKFIREYIDDATDYDPLTVGYWPDNDMGVDGDICTTNIFTIDSNTALKEPIVFVKVNGAWIVMIKNTRYNSLNLNNLNIYSVLGRDELYIYYTERLVDVENRLTSYFIGVEDNYDIPGKVIIEDISEATGYGFVYDCINNKQYIKFKGSTWIETDIFMSFLDPYYYNGHKWYLDKDTYMSNFGEDGDILYNLSGLYDKDFNEYDIDSDGNLIPKISYLDYYIYIKRDGKWVPLTPYFSNDYWATGDDDLHRLRVRTTHGSLDIATKAEQYYYNSGFPTLRGLKYWHIFNDIEHRDLQIKIHAEDKCIVGLNLKDIEHSSLLRIQTTDGIKSLD